MHRISADSTLPIKVVNLSVYLAPFAASIIKLVVDVFFYTSVPLDKGTSSRLGPDPITD